MKGTDKKITGKDGKRYTVRVLNVSADGATAKVAMRHYAGFTGNMRRNYSYGKPCWINVPQEWTR